MIYSILVLPCRNLLAPLPDALNALFDFVSRIGLITPIVLRLEGATDVFVKGQQTQLGLILKQLTRIAPCHIEGIPLPSDEMDSTLIEEFAIGMLGIQMIKLAVSSTSTHFPPLLHSLFSNRRFRGIIRHI